MFKDSHENLIGHYPHYPIISIVSADNIGPARDRLLQHLKMQPARDRPLQHLVIEKVTR